MNVLIVEDDPRIRSLLERGLSENGHRVSHVGDGRGAVRMLLEQSFDAALLDVLLPGLDGLMVLEQVRAQRCKTPILMLTAMDTVPRIVRAFDLGADDYIVKPFILEVLLARLSAAVRRLQPGAPEITSAGNLMLDPVRRTLRNGDRLIHLTRKQCGLMALLMRRNGMVTSREDLIEAGWGSDGHVKENTLEVYVHGLRTKLESGIHESQTTIRTIHGVGYMLQAV